MWVTFKRIFRSGFVDFWRNGFVSFSAVVIMVVTLSIIAFTFFAGFIVNTTVSQLRDRADIIVYFVPTAPEDAILEFKKQIDTLPEVASSSYVTKDDALAHFRDLHKNNQLVVQALDELHNSSIGDPLGAELSIKSKDIKQYGAIAQFIEQQQTSGVGVNSIINSISYNDENQKAALNTIENISSSAQKLGLAFTLILIFGTIAICLNTIRLVIYVSREEIAVMRLVGAGQFYIRAPFMVEGVLYGFIGSLITLLLLYPLTYWLGNATQEFFGGINVFYYYLQNFPFFLLILMGTGVVLGAVGSFLAVRRYLQI